MKMQSEGKADAIKVEDSLWKVSSESRSAHYLVRLNDKECICRLRCSSCGICVHTYTYSCVDYVVHSTPCKHCHIVQMKSATATTPQLPISVSTVDITKVGELTSFLQRSDAVHNHMRTGQ